MAENQKIWKRVEKEIISLLYKQNELMYDMFRNVNDSYTRKRISRFRVLCCGYILIAKTNTDAAILLIDNRLVPQVNYISRNMFEMVVSLYYIDNDKTNKDGLAMRYFDYQNVNNYKGLEVMRKYPEVFESIRNEKRDREIEEKYMEYKEEYSENKKNWRNNWSGKSLYEMINKIKDKKIKDALLEYYHKIITINNKYLHPTTTYLRDIINRKYVDEGYEVIVAHLVSIYFLNELIINMYLQNFSKGRIAFSKHLEEINSTYRAIARSIS